MKAEFEIQQKTASDALERKANSTMAISELAEVQAIKNAIQEHFLFIGMDRRNNIKNIRLLGIGSCNEINIDSKEIIRTALLTESERIVLVHNHPSSSLVPSEKDCYLTNYTSKILELFNIRMIDHIIVTDKGYYSMGKNNEIDFNFKDNKLEFVESTFLKEENEKLKEKIKKLTEKEKNKDSR